MVLRRLLLLAENNLSSEDHSKNYEFAVISSSFDQLGINSIQESLNYFVLPTGESSNFLIKDLSSIIAYIQ